MRIVARKCRISGKIFEESQRDKYAAHLRELRAARAKVNRTIAIHRDYTAWLTAEKMKITDVADIAPWFMDNQRYIMDAVNAGVTLPNSNLWGTYDKFHDKDQYTDLHLNLKYDRHVSNSHNCPENGVVNWCANQNDLPTGYPGWKGMIRGVLKRPKNVHGYPYSNALKIVGLLTGSGGGGNEKWGYDISIFAEDWPGLWSLHNQYEEALLVGKLMGTK